MERKKWDTVCQTLATVARDNNFWLVIGQVLTHIDYYKSGPGYIIEDIPVYSNITFFSRFGWIFKSLLWTAFLNRLYHGETAWAQS